jgi:hypothetical protein
MGLISDLRARVTHARRYVAHLTTQARQFIYNLGKPITGVAVERLLKAKSLVPTVVCVVCSILDVQHLNSMSECLRRQTWLV